MANKKAKHIKTQVLIIGGGLSGLTMAAVLAESGVNVVCIDRDDPKKQGSRKYDGRTTAISYASHKVIKAAGAWEEMLKHSAPILDIRVVDNNSPVFLHFDSEEDGKGEAFGWVIDNMLMRECLFKNIKRLKKHATHLAPAEIKKFIKEDSCVGITLKDGTKITAPLMIGADGRQSATREWLGIDVTKSDYHQTAIVCNAAHEFDHENVAVENFRPSGPFAALPMTTDKKDGFRSSIVWSEHGTDANEITKLPAKEFDARLQELAGDSLGKIRHVSKPMAYPLSLMLAKSYIGHRTALIAEAAHAVHPIAGQGLNLSMRDVALLSELITDNLKLGLDIGSPSILKKYERIRKTDTHLMAAVTDILTRLFSNNLRSVKLIRNIGLGAVQRMPFLKRYFAKQAMGLSGVQGKIIKN